MLMHNQVKLTLQRFPLPPAYSTAIILSFDNTLLQHEPRRLAQIRRCGHQPVIECRNCLGYLLNENICTVAIHAVEQAYLRDEEASSFRDCNLRQKFPRSSYLVPQRLLTRCPFFAEPYRVPIELLTSFNHIDPCPNVGGWVDLQRPLTMTNADELRWT